MQKEFMAEYCALCGFGDTLDHAFENLQDIVEVDLLSEIEEVTFYETSRLNVKKSFIIIK